jgi:hypothetical protein
MESASMASHSHSWENKQYLIKTIMNQLGISEEDLEKHPSFIRAKVREMKLDSILEDNKNPSN